MLASKVTKKGQVTIPAEARERFNLQEGTVVLFKEGRGGLILEAVPDINDSAGKLSKFGNAGQVLRELMRTREEEFR